MADWRKFENTFCSWPAKPKGLIELIGGSYISAAPQVTYRNLLNGLQKSQIAIHAWAYFPGFDHQLQAVQAWRELRTVKSKLEKRIGYKLQNIRLGHSLGCKLHLLSPDGGRNSDLFIAISFNNYPATRSIPILKKVSSRFKIQSEFSPSPMTTLDLIKEFYFQEKNILISFSNDKIDETKVLYNCLRSRETTEDQSKIISLSGDHLTPASVGISKEIFGVKNISVERNNNINKLLKIVLQEFEI